MGYTSKQIDEDLLLRDIEVIFALEGARQEMEIKKIAAGVAMAFAGSEKKGDRSNGRR